MCGICGKMYFDSNRSVEPNIIEAMNDSMLHRGPDGCGIYLNNNVGLGHRRLSIIDLDAGKQPMTNEDGSLWITYNGEIYNYIEIRKNLLKNGHIFKTESDTEVILHLYEDMGENCLKELRGMFAFCIWDTKNKTLFLARDRVGIKPLYYCVTKDAIIFSSEIKSIIKDPSVDKSVDLNGIYKFLCYTFTPAPETVFRNIKKLFPGQYIIVKNNRIHKNEYWDLLSFYSETDYHDKNIESNLEELLKDTVKKHMISDVPVGFLLSGGVDSTGMLYFYQDMMKTKIKTFTIGFESNVFEDERYYARIAAKKFGTEHYETTINEKQFFDFLPEYINYMEEPIFEPPGISLYFLTKMAREHVKVLISGEGGDEAFAGYQTYRNIVWLERIKKYLLLNDKISLKKIDQLRMLPKNNKYSKYFHLLGNRFDDYYTSRTNNQERFFNYYSASIFSDNFRHTIDESNLSKDFVKYISASGSFSLLKKMLYVDTKTWLPDRLLLKADKMTMANSLELRVPLLDHKVLELAAKLPDCYKLNGFKTKYIFKKVLKNKLPKEIINRKKAGFTTPYQNWLSNNKEAVLDILIDPNTLSRGYFKINTLKNVLIKRWIEEGKYPEEIFNLITLELWHRRFVD